MIFINFVRLILQNAIENLDVSTKDPFESTEPRNQWIPMKSLQVLNNSAFTAIDEILSGIC